MQFTLAPTYFTMFSNDKYDRYYIGVLTATDAKNTDGRGHFWVMDRNKTGEGAIRASYTRKD